MIFNLTTYFYLRAYNIPTCLAKVSESKLNPNDRVSVDSPGFESKRKQIFTSRALTNRFPGWKKKNFFSYVQFLMGIGCFGPNLHEISKKMRLTNLFNAIRPLDFEKMSFFCSTVHIHLQDLWLMFFKKIAAASKSRSKHLGLFKNFWLMPNSEFDISCEDSKFLKKWPRALLNILVKFFENFERPNWGKKTS